MTPGIKRLSDDVAMRLENLFFQRLPSVNTEDIREGFSVKSFTDGGEEWLLHGKPVLRIGPARVEYDRRPEGLVVMRLEVPVFPTNNA